MHVSLSPQQCFTFYFTQSSMQRVSEHTHSTVNTLTARTSKGHSSERLNNKGATVPEYTGAHQNKKERNIVFLTLVLLHKIKGKLLKRECQNTNTNFTHNVKTKLDTYVKSPQASACLCAYASGEAQLATFGLLNMT